MEIKILPCVLPARVYHRCMRRNQSALQYLHSICNMRFNPSPCVQSPAYIFCQICQNLFYFFLSVTTEFYLRTCKLYMISFFPHCTSDASWWRGLPAPFLPALSWQVQQCVRAHGMCQNMKGEQKGSKF